MYGVLKIAQLAYSATEEDVKNLFKINSVYPEDVHWVLNANGKKSGVAFVAFKVKDIKKAMNLDGMYFRGHRIDVMASSDTEFNSYFPKKSMVHHQPPVQIETDWHRQTRNDYPNDYKYETRKIVMDNGYDNQYYDVNARPSEPSQAYSTRFEDRDHYSSFPYVQDAVYTRPYPQSTTVPESTSRRDTLRRDDPKREPLKREPPNREVSTAQRKQAGNKNDHKQPNGKKHRSRSRSPVSKSKKDDKHSSHKRSENVMPKKNEKEKKNVSEKQYVRIVGMKFKSNESDFKRFMKPLDVDEIYLLNFKSGDNAGKPNGSAIIKLQKEEHHSKALLYDGKNYKGIPIQVIRTAKEDILAAIKDKQNKSSKLSADLGTLSDLANSNPQIQRLVGLLNEAVSNATAQGSPKSSSTKSKKSSSSTITSRSDKHEKSNSNRSHGASYSTRSGSQGSRSSTKKEDPVINRVASSANIDVEDIKSGRVVGMRNLPSHINTNTILDFFVGYKRIDESVRIHYLDNNQCSGDAIIAFRTSEEARRAVKNLNKRQVSGRKVELFFL